MAPRYRLDEEEEKPDAKSPEPQFFTAVPQALFKARTVLIFGEVDMKMAERVTANLLALSADDPNKDIKIVIHSPGVDKNLPLLVEPGRNESRGRRGCTRAAPRRGSCGPAARRERRGS